MYFACFSKKKILCASAVILTFIVACISLNKFGTYPVFYGKNLRLLPIYRVQTEEKKVALTFDCAWGVDYTDLLLNTMQEEGVKCTFFTVEFWAKTHPEYLKKIVDFGHEVGTHSATHPHMNKLDVGIIEKELSTSIECIESITNKKVELFRAPFGEYNDRVISTASKMNLFTIQWDVDSLDWKDLTSEKIIERVLKGVKNGSIVLFHNQGKHTASALPKIIRSLKERGYEIVPVGQLIYRENYIMGADGAQIKNS